MQSNLYLDQVFKHPAIPHLRKHGPAGYKDHSSFRPWLRDEFSFRCVYCLNREQWTSFGGNFDIDHFVPREVNPSLSLDYDNLVYACHRCNLTKSSKLIPDPSRFGFGGCIELDADGTYRPLDQNGVCLIELMDLNDPSLIRYRLLIADILMLAKQSESSIFQRMLGLPENCPNLRRLRPPGGNQRPEGLNRCWHIKRGDPHV